MYLFKKLLYWTHPHRASRNQNWNKRPDVRIPYFLLYTTKIAANIWNNNQILLNITYRAHTIKQMYLSFLSYKSMLITL